MSTRSTFPIVPFVLTSYWSSYYAGRPWYHRRAHWGGYWRSHERVATQLTIDRSAARIGRAAAARDAARPEARERVGVEERSRASVPSEADPCRCDGTHDAGEGYHHA